MLKLFVLILLLTGTQTLGGVFVRNMKITTKQEQTVSELYSAASSKISECNKQAFSTGTDMTARKGFLGVGAR